MRLKSAGRRDASALRLIKKLMKGQGEDGDATALAVELNNALNDKREAVKLLVTGLDLLD